MAMHLKAITISVNRIGRGDSLMESITLAPGETIKSIELSTFVEDDGQILRIPLYLWDVCACDQIIVGVFIFKDDKLYAKRIKEVYVQGPAYCAGCHEFFAGEFEFLFEESCMKDVRIKVMAHYIYPKRTECIKAYQSVRSGSKQFYRTRSRCSKRN